MACYCCVLGCRNNNHKTTDKHFFRFPKNDEKRRKLWRRFARKKSIKPTAVICEDHFESRYMVQKDKKLKLTNDAVPTMFHKNTNNGLEKITISFNGEQYIGKEAEELEIACEMMKEQEIVAIETAFVNEQLKLDELKCRCRFCAESKDELIDITSFVTYNIDIASFLRLLNLHIIESDFFPNSICEDCFNQVVLLDTFIVKCKGANEWLWDEISKLKTVSTTVAISRGEQRDETLSMTNEGDVDCTEEINDSYGEMIQECKSEQGEATENIFSMSFEQRDDSLVKSPEILQHQRDDQQPIIDPRYNKFAMKNYNCEICLKVFAGLKTYKNHVCDVPEIRCAECGDIFETVFAMKRHRRHLHSDKQQKNYCPICKAVITGKLAVFKKHKTKCNRERVERIQCELCQKNFTTLHGYTVHKMFHDSKKISEQDVLATDSGKPTKKKADVICELCGKVYTTVGDCRRHIKLKHTEISELFSCDICNKNYPSKSVLKDHFRNTHVVDEVACTFCGKIFRNKTHLKKHMVYHDDSKKVHKCFICPDQPGFINKVGLIRHQARHANHEEKVFYSCEICVNYNFHTSLQLKSHLKHVHGIDQ